MAARLTNYWTLVYNLGLTTVHLDGYSDHEAALDSCSNNFRRDRELRALAPQRRDRRHQAIVCQLVMELKGNSTNPNGRPRRHRRRLHCGAAKKISRKANATNPVMMPERSG